MSWAAGDEELKAAALVKLSRARSVLYELDQAVGRIKHAEKRTVLAAYMQEAWKAVDRVAMVLSR